MQQAASSVDRLRTFVSRLETGKFPAGASAEMAARAAKAREEFEDGLADDLNTAQALAAIFDLVRDVNIAIDKGEFLQGDAAPVLAVLQSFDAIFAVLQDDDAEKLRSLGLGQDSAGPSDAEIDALVAERQAARSAAILPLPTASATSLPRRELFWKIRATAACAGSASDARSCGPAYGRRRR